MTSATKADGEPSTAVDSSLAPRSPEFGDRARGTTAGEIPVTMPPPAVAAADHHDPVVAWRRSSANLPPCSSCVAPWPTRSTRPVLTEPSSRLAAAYLLNGERKSAEAAAGRVPGGRGGKSDWRGAQLLAAL